ncbi:MAG: hypothetical protein JHC93_08520, partial [Parachlamydiales bacterium]|nr:hypothetical protein [Parachlamydiales bacterium]
VNNNKHYNLQSPLQSHEGQQTSSINFINDTDHSKTANLKDVKVVLVKDSSLVSNDKLLKTVDQAWEENGSRPASPLTPVLSYDSQERYLFSNARNELNSKFPITGFNERLVYTDKALKQFIANSLSIDFSSLVSTLKNPKVTWNSLAIKSRDELATAMKTAVAAATSGAISHEKLYTYLFIASFIYDYKEELPSAKVSFIDTIEDYPALDDYLLGSPSRIESFKIRLSDADDFDRNVVRVTFNGKGKEYFHLFAQDQFNFGLFSPKYDEVKMQTTIDIPSFEVLVNALQCRYGQHAMVPIGQFSLCSIADLLKFHKDNFHPLAFSLPSVIELNGYDGNYPSGIYGAIIHDIYHMNDYGIIPKSHRMLFIEMAQYLLERHSEFKFEDQLVKTIHQLVEVENHYRLNHTPSIAYYYNLRKNGKAEELDDKEMNISYGLLEEDDCSDTAAQVLLKVFADIESNSSLNGLDILERFNIKYNGKIEVEEESDDQVPINLNFQDLKSKILNKMLKKSESSEIKNI